MTAVAVHVMVLVEDLPVIASTDRKTMARNSTVFTHSIWKKYRKKVFHSYLLQKNETQYNIDKNKRNKDGDKLTDQK